MSLELHSAVLWEISRLEDLIKKYESQGPVGAFAVIKIKADIYDLKKHFEYDPDFTICDTLNRLKLNN